MREPLTRSPSDEMTHLSEALPRTAAILQRGIAEQMHLGAQLFVARRGKVVVDGAVGEARVGVPMTSETVLLWLSSGKPITAVAVAQLWEKGQLRLEDPVSRFIPEFGEGGKEGVSIRHLLTHTCGLRLADKCDLGTDWDEIIACVCQTPLEPNWIPGARAAYHPSASWYLLGELVRRLDGRPFEQYVRDEILQPLGLQDVWLALPPDRFKAYGDLLGIMYHTEKAPPTPHRRWNTEADAAVCRPGRNARGPIRELGKFYQTLLELRSAADAGTSAPIVQPATVRALTSRQRAGMFDDTFQQVVDWGFGFAIDSKRYGREMVSYGFGALRPMSPLGMAAPNRRVRLRTRPMDW